MLGTFFSLKESLKRCEKTPASCPTRILRTFGLTLSGPLALMHLVLDESCFARSKVMMGEMKREWGGKVWGGGGERVNGRRMGVRGGRR